LNAQRFSIRYSFVSVRRNSAPSAAAYDASVFSFISFFASCSYFVPAFTTKPTPDSFWKYTLPSPRIGDAEKPPPRRSFQWTLPVFASKQLATPLSDTAYNSSPSSSSDGVFGAPSFAVQATCVSVTSPLPSARIAISVGESKLVERK